MLTRTLSLAIVVGLIAAACVPADGDSSTTADESTTTTDTLTSVADPPDESGSSEDRPDPGTSLDPPVRGDPDDTARDAIWAPVNWATANFTVGEQPTLFATDALEAVERWLPEDLVDGLAWQLFVDESDTWVLAVSVIPSLTWRGDPNFVPALIVSLSDADAHEVAPAIYVTETQGGLILSAWSTGDGFVVATSIVRETATAYLEALATQTSPQQVWEEGACLYIDPQTETLPYAPFPPDIVVPCAGPHTAEVLISLQIGTSLTEFDADAIHYERNYECDKAYTEMFGLQRDHKPSLITYMPDEDEWSRGDRYLACIVQLETVEGPELVAGPMAQLPDLSWDPEPGICLDRSFVPDEVGCTSVHGYQYVGDATVSFDDWPADGTDAFRAACTNLVDDFVQPGPAEVDVFATDLFPFAFEQGDRSVRCMAFAVEDGQLLNVVGSFDEVWRVIGTGGIAT